MIRMERQLTQDLGRSTKRIRSTIEKTRFFRILLKAIGVLAVSMVMADGVLTPAQSVLGAVQGLTVVNESIEKSTIVGVTCAILILLFVLQPLGISKLTMVFSPIIVLWLAFNAGFGVYNLAKYVHTFKRIPCVLISSGMTTACSRPSIPTMRLIILFATSTRAGVASEASCSALLELRHSLPTLVPSLGAPYKLVGCATHSPASCSHTVAKPRTLARIQAPSKIPSTIAFPRDGSFRLLSLHFVPRL
jgi:hypothetical protein